MKLAIRGHDLGKRGEFDLVEGLCRYGFDGVQLVPHKTYRDFPYSPDIDLAKVKTISEGLKKANKEIFLLGAYFNPVHSNEEKVENGIAVFERYLELAKDFGCDTVGSETGSFNDDKWTYNPKNRTDGALDTVIKTFSRLNEKAKAAGAYVAMEGAAGHVCWCVERHKEAVDAIGKNDIRIIFDLYNYLDDENYKDYKLILDKGLKTFEKRIHIFHMKNCRIEDGKLKQCAIGKGIFDYEWLLAAIREYDENAKLVLEGTTGENIAPSVELIKSISNK